MAIVLMLGFGLSAQTNETMTRDKKKQERVAQEEASWIRYRELAANKSFIIEINQAGNNTSLSPRLNFLYVKQDSAVFQLQSFPGISTNGLGGFTLNGTIFNYRYTPPKKRTNPFTYNSTSSRKIGQECFILT